MKTNTKFKNKILLGSMLAFMLVLSACAPNDVEVIDNISNPIEVIQNIPIDDDISIIVEEGSSPINIPVLEESLVNNSTGVLSTEEIEGLLFMREEEKLAQDVYLYLAEVWDLQIFSFIARSEATHTEAVRHLLETNGIEDPAVSTELGEFADPILQNLYNQLVEEGSLSLENALRVGTAIEEIDILDLEKYIEETDNESIILVYNNLLKGSFNHLRAFVRSLENKTGEIFEPQYLKLDAYEIIFNSSSGNGGNRNVNGGNGKGRNGQNGN